MSPQFLRHSQIIQMPQLPLLLVTTALRHTEYTTFFSNRIYVASVLGIHVLFYFYIYSCICNHDVCTNNMCVGMHEPIHNIYGIYVIHIAYVTGPYIIHCPSCLYVYFSSVTCMPGMLTKNLILTCLLRVVYIATAHLSTSTVIMLSSLSFTTIISFCRCVLLPWMSDMGPST